MHKIKSKLMALQTSVYNHKTTLLNISFQHGETLSQLFYD